MKKCKLLLLDLDGTLLQSDKTISTRTLSALKKCRENDILIGVSTSRSEQNSLVFLNELMPDILISSGGALVKYKTEYIYRAEFSEEETNVMIDMARNICGNDCAWFEEIFEEYKFKKTKTNIDYWPKTKHAI